VVSYSGTLNSTSAQDLGAYHLLPRGRKRQFTKANPCAVRRGRCLQGAGAIGGWKPTQGLNLPERERYTLGLCTRATPTRRASFEVALFLTEFTTRPGIPWGSCYG